MSEQLVEIKNTAFAKYLLSIHEESAIAHIWECMRDGEADNYAWKLWEAVHAEKGYSTDQIRGALIQMLNALKD